MAFIPTVFCAAISVFILLRPNGKLLTSHCSSSVSWNIRVFTLHRLLDFHGEHPAKAAPCFPKKIGGKSRNFHSSLKKMQLFSAAQLWLSFQTMIPFTFGSAFYHGVQTWHLSRNGSTSTLICQISFTEQSEVNITTHNGTWRNLWKNGSLNFHTAFASPSAWTVVWGGGLMYGSALEVLGIPAQTSVHTLSWRRPISWTQFYRLPGIAWRPYSEQSGGCGLQYCIYSDDKKLLLRPGYWWLKSYLFSFTLERNPHAGHRRCTV